MEGTDDVVHTRCNEYMYDLSRRRCRYLKYKTHEKREPMRPPNKIHLLTIWGEHKKKTAKIHRVIRYPIFVDYYVPLLESSRGNFGFEKRTARYGTRSCPGLTTPSVKKLQVPVKKAGYPYFFANSQLCTIR